MIKTNRIQTKRKTVYVYAGREYNTREALRDRVALDIADRVIYHHYRRNDTIQEQTRLRSKALRRLRKLIPDGVMRDGDGKFR